MTPWRNRKIQWKSCAISLMGWSMFWWQLIAGSIASQSSQVFSIHLCVHLHIDIRCMQIRDGGADVPPTGENRIKESVNLLPEVDCRKKKMRLNCRSVTFHGSWQSCYSNSLLFFTKCCQSHKKICFSFFIPQVFQ